MTPRRQRPRVPAKARPSAARPPSPAIGGTGQISQALHGDGGHDGGGGASSGGDADTSDGGGGVEEGGSFNALSNDEGEFQIDGVPAGRYDCWMCEVTEDGSLATY